MCSTFPIRNKISYLQAAHGLGIGLGSFAAGYLSGGKIEYGLIPLGLRLGMTVLAALLGAARLSFANVAVDLALLGFFGGFFIVPISALLQHRPDRKRQGRRARGGQFAFVCGHFRGVRAIYFLVTVVLHLNPSTVFLLAGGG